jgi:hypothetical protein
MRQYDIDYEQESYRRRSYTREDKPTLAFTFV